MDNLQKLFEEMDIPTLGYPDNDDICYNCLCIDYNGNFGCFFSQVMQFMKSNDFTELDKDDMIDSFKFMKWLDLEDHIRIYFPEIDYYDETPASRR